MNVVCFAAESGSLTGALKGLVGIPTIWLGISLVCFLLSAGFLLCIAQRSYRGTHATAKPRTRKLVGLGLGMALLGVLGLIGWQRSAPPASTDQQKAADYIIHVLQTDEVARLDHLQHAGVQRGPRDSKRVYNANGEEIVPDAGIQAASRLVTALTEGDLQTLRSLIRSYKFRPHARAQIAESLN